MKAISLWEPWASLIMCKAKWIETRSWRTFYRGNLLICAAKKKDKGQLIHLLAHWSFQGGLAPLKGEPLDLSFSSWPGIKMDDLNFGNAVAVVELYDCKKTLDITLREIEIQQHYGDFSRDRFGWFFKNIRPIKPFPVKGSQGFFDVDVPKQNL